MKGKQIILLVIAVLLGAMLVAFLIAFFIEKQRTSSDPNAQQTPLTKEERMEKTLELQNTLKKQSTSSFDNLEGKAKVNAINKTIGEIAISTESKSSRGERSEKLNKVLDLQEELKAAYEAQKNSSVDN